MKTRAITGFFFVVVMLASMLTGPYTFYVFFLILSVLCLREFYGLIKQSGYAPNQLAGLMNGALIFIAIALINYSNYYGRLHAIAGFSYQKLIFILPLTLSIIWIQELYKHTETPFINIAYTFLGLMFTIVPFSFFHALAYAGNGYNFHLPLGFMIMLWANDTGAYITGRAFGKHKLFERHSPKKTWEGFIGGVIISAAAAFVLGRFYTEMALQHWVIMAVIISGFGTLGDLVESMFKRSINVKDSGGILPGHGGLLDRFDGLLLAAPVVYTYLYFALN